MSTKAIEVNNLYKAYKSVNVLNGLELEVVSGICCLLGRNGAGKTTLINILSGVRRPDKGNVSIFGNNPKVPRAREVLGTTPQNTGFPGQLRVTELLDFVRAHFPKAFPLHDLIKSFGLEDYAKRQLGGLSPGIQRQVALAVAFAGHPKLVILDEPSVGLDVENRHIVWSFIENYASAGNTIVFSTHDMAEADRYASEIQFLADGHLTLWRNLTQDLAGLTILEVLADDSKNIKVSNARRVISFGNTLKICTATPEKALAEIIHFGLPANKISTREITLEDVILFDLAKG
ncbi:MAG: ABC transporter ATP-binding protein [Trueperaceae bacterium]